MKVQVTGGVQTDYRKIITATPVQFRNYIGLPEGRLLGQEFDLGTDEARTLIAQGAVTAVSPPVASTPDPAPESESKPAPAKRRGQK